MLHAFHSLYFKCSPSVLCPFSKKDVALRRKELLEAVSPHLIQHLCDHARTMAMDKASSVTVTVILGSAIGDLHPAMEAVAELAADDFTPGGVEGQVRRGQGHGVPVKFK